MKVCVLNRSENKNTYKKKSIFNMKVAFCIKYNCYDLFCNKAVYYDLFSFNEVLNRRL